MLRRVAGLTLFAVLVAGCYSLEPTTNPTPEVGKVMAFDINDAGRVALGGAMGPEIGQIEGRLLSRDSDYVVSVSAVRLVRGGEQSWSGEPVHIKPSYVSSIYERRYSTGRTLAASALGVGIVVALATRSILGSGAQDPAMPTDTGTTQRIPRP